MDGWIGWIGWVGGWVEEGREDGGREAREKSDGNVFMVKIRNDIVESPVTEVILKYLIRYTL